MTKPNSNRGASVESSEDGDGYTPTIDPSRIISDEPGPVISGETPVKLWGDEASGFVNDWIYVSSAELLQIVFSLPPGRAFRHSEKNRTVFGGDEVFYVLSGTLMLANPETGEVVRLEKGQAAFFRPNTWHHAFSYGTQELQVLEFFAPPPAAGMSQTYARTRPYLSESTYVADELIGQWPEQVENVKALATIKPIRDEDVLWRLEGDGHVSVGILLSTHRLTVGCIELLPGQTSDDRIHGGDLGIYVLDGRLNLYLAEHDGDSDWFELNPADGFYLPARTPYRLFNMTGGIVRAIFGVAPSYLLELSDE